MSAAETGLATPEMTRYYELFAKGDFGLVITEGLPPIKSMLRATRSNQELAM